MIRKDIAIGISIALIVLLTLGALGQVSFMWFWGFALLAFIYLQFYKNK